jgi:divalent metal cation (Fe/Co/Zn/Cd) transporter
VWYESKRGRELGSDILLADAMSTRINIFVSLSALAGLIGAQLGFAWLDIVVALGIVAFVIRAAYRIIRETSEVLTDSAVVDPHLVEDIARRVPGVWFASKVRSRGREDDVHLDLHIKVDPAMATEQAHSIASEVEQQLRTKVPGLVDAIVHIEPGETAPLSEWDAITVRLRAMADGLGLGVHNIHIDVLPHGYLVDVDVEVDSMLSLEKSHALANEFETRARSGLPQLVDIVTHIEPALPGHFPPQIANTEADGLHDRIVAITDRIGGPGACHHVILRHGHAPNRIDVSLHCSAPGDSPLIAAHLLAEEIERNLRAELPLLDHVAVHVEPPGALDQ